MNQPTNEREPNWSGEHTCPEVENCPYCLLDACETMLRHWYDLRFTPSQFLKLAIDNLCLTSNPLLDRLAVASRAREP